MIILSVTPAGQECESCKPRMDTPADKPAPVSAADVNASLRKWEQELLKQADAKEEIHKPDPKAQARERHAVFNTVVAVENALRRLPQGHAEVAGYLMGQGYSGGQMGNDNALTAWVRQQIQGSLPFYKAPKPVQDLMSQVDLWLEANGTVVESRRYQMALDPMPWQDMFFMRLRTGDFPKLLRR